VTARSYMRPEKVREAVRTLYGKDSGAQRAFANAIGKHELTVSRYVTGRAPVGHTEAILIRLLLQNRREQINRGNLDNFNDLD